MEQNNCPIFSDTFLLFKCLSLMFPWRFLFCLCIQSLSVSSYKAKMIIFSGLVSFIALDLCYLPVTWWWYRLFLYVRTGLSRPWLLFRHRFSCTFHGMMVSKGTCWALPEYLLSSNKVVVENLFIQCLSNTPTSTDHKSLLDQSCVEFLNVKYPHFCQVKFNYVN